MSNKIFEEALADARRLKEVAEDNAKKAIIEAVTPKIREFIEGQLLEGDPDEDDQNESHCNEEEEEEEEVVLDEASLRSLSKLLGVDGLTENSKQKKILQISNKINQNIDILESSLINNKDVKNEEKSAMTKEKFYEVDLKMLRESIQQGLYEGAHDGSIVDDEIDDIEDPVDPMDEPIDDLEFDLDEVMHGSMEEAEHGHGSLEEDMYEDMDEDMYEDMDEDMDDDMLKEAILDLVLPLGDLDKADLDDEIQAFIEERDEDEEDVDFDEDEDEDEDSEEDEGEFELDFDEDEDEDEDEDSEDEDEADAQDETYAVDEDVLAEELLRIKKLINEAKTDSMQKSFGGKGAAKAGVKNAFGGSGKKNAGYKNAFGGGNYGSDPFANPPAINKLNEALRKQRRTNRALNEKLTKYRSAFQTLREQLEDLNLFNAKLLYVNKLLQNKGLNESEKKSIIKALDASRSLSEAKSLYNSLTETFRRDKKSTINESLRYGSSSRTTTSASSGRSQASGELDRWQKLAGLKK